MSNNNIDNRIQENKEVIQEKRYSNYSRDQELLTAVKISDNNWQVSNSKTSNIYNISKTATGYTCTCKDFMERCNKVTPSLRCKHIIHVAMSQSVTTAPATVPTTTTKSILERLSEPFPVECLKTKKNRSGKVLSYIPVHQVISRLNEVLDMKWSFKVLEKTIQGDEIVVLGQLKTKIDGEEIIKEQYGGQMRARLKSDRNVYAMDLCDDMKAAGSDSLKKCSSLLGVGLYLCDLKEVVPNPRPMETTKETPTKPATKPQNIPANVTPLKPTKPTHYNEMKPVKNLSDFDMNEINKILSKW
jgi:hypothetical protein